MISVKKYLVYARAPFASASAVPVLLGAALAWRATHGFDLLNLALTFAGMIFAHLGVNLFNDYHDFRQGADQNNRFRNPFSGGSPFLVEGLERPERIRNLALVSLAVAFGCGAALMARVDHGIGPVFWLMLAGFVGGYGYTGPPLKFAYRGCGEVFIFLDFGVLPVLGVYYVLTGTLSWAPVLVAIPIGCLTTNILWINQFPDYESDRDSGKRTLVVRLGTGRARFGYACLLFLAAFSIVVAPWCLGLSKHYYVGLLGLIPAIRATRILFLHHHDPPKLLKGQTLTIVAQLATGVLLAIALLT